jgi:ubiquinone/menaquinone biosynthesis C-methylase UbiE
MVIGQKYADADGYDAYMGGWSARLAQPFLEFAGVVDGGTIVDLGCGTGNLLAAAASVFPHATLIGVDPSSALLAKARGRAMLSGAMLLRGGIEAIPLPDASADHTLSLLVLQEFSDRPAAMAEMRRITRSGGSIAGCQWDFRRMPVIDALMRAIEAVHPAATVSIAANSPRTFDDEAELADCWRSGGLTDVRAGRITVTQRFDSFEALWRPLLGGTTPSTLALAALAPAEQLTVKRDIARQLHWPADQPLSLSAEALVVTGRV